jgi:hypothetical protein
LLWVVASVVALLAVVLCVTIILLPLGIPLLMVAKRMFGQAVGLMLPRGLTHPVDEGSKKAKKGSKRGRKKAGKLADKSGKAINNADKAGKRGDKKIAELAKGGGAKVRELAGGKKKSRLPWR